MSEQTEAPTQLCSVGPAMRLLPSSLHMLTLFFNLIPLGFNETAFCPLKPHDKAGELERKTNPPF